MLSKKPLINPILICPIIALFSMFLVILFVFQLSQYLFINHYHDRIRNADYYRKIQRDGQYWNEINYDEQHMNRRRPTFGQRTHRTEQENQLELALDRQILANQLYDPNRRFKHHDLYPIQQRLVRRAEHLPKTRDETLFKEHPEQAEKQIKWPIFGAVGRTKTPVVSVNKERPVDRDSIVYDFVDDFSASSNLLNFEVEGSGIGTDKYHQVDASVISREEEDDGTDFNMVPPLSRRFFAKAK